MAILFAPVAPIRLVRGTLWTDELQVLEQETGDPVNLAGIEGLLMRVRRSISAPILLELALEDGLELVNATSGLLRFNVPSARTLTLPENGNRKAKYVYDAVIERTPNEYEAAIAGKLVVLPCITRPWAAT